MEDKKTFGGYICRRRKELGMTQREFARKVYVTESAVSKWERGMSYPDITLVRDICEVLDITEHELLTASDDTEKCRQERLAEEYARTVRRCRHGLYVIFAAALTACAVVNLRTGGGWFLIAAALTALMASLLLAPLLLNGTKLQPWRICISLGCAVVSMDLLFLACCAYSGPQWVSTLFPVLFTGGHLAAGLLLLPAILPQLPLTEAARRHKALCYMAANSIVLTMVGLGVLAVIFGVKGAAYQKKACMK